MTARRVVRFVGLLFGVVGGLEYALFIITKGATPGGFGERSAVLVLCSLAGGIFGFFGLEYVTTRPFYWFETRLRQTPLPDLASAIIGLTVGLVLAALAGFFLGWLPYGLNFITSAALALLLGYWGVSLGLGRRDELFAVLRGIPLEAATITVIDTSVVIDGRVVDIAKAGFLRGKMIAPHFMLTELQQVADSADPVRRQRGRRGLEIMEELRRMPGLTVEVSDTDFIAIAEVDEKLLRLAKLVHGAILTTDYNLNKLAKIEGVAVLNVNDLANALKPAVVPGEELVVTPIKEGKEPNQGVAYLVDGTMVVVEGGRPRLNQTFPVRVTSVIQTPAGRMIFAAATAALGSPAAAGRIGHP
ncbi:MAG TPA: hypothetical protein VG245_11055 [Candidatus Dormibacteraeota bacterium]|nr:hypothetical protein [Candidatus Dormibacteraeota bacterium]